MAKKQEWTVRVINFEDGPGALRNHLRGVWVEQLRYMGFVKELANLENPPRTVLEFYAPRGADSQIWAQQNAERMRSFGIDAAAAPKWGDGIQTLDQVTDPEHPNREQRRHV